MQFHSDSIITQGRLSRTDTSYAHVCVCRTASKQSFNRVQGCASCRHAGCCPKGIGLGWGEEGDKGYHKEVCCGDGRVQQAAHNNNWSRRLCPKRVEGIPRIKRIRTNNTRTRSFNQTCDHCYAGDNVRVRGYPYISVRPWVRWTRGMDHGISMAYSHICFYCPIASHWEVHWPVPRLPSRGYMHVTFTLAIWSCGWAGCVMLCSQAQIKEVELGSRSRLLLDNSGHVNPNEQHPASQALDLPGPSSQLACCHTKLMCLRVLWIKNLSLSLFL